MRCLVIGAYGFIGRYLVHELVANRFEVIGGGRDLELGRRLLPDIAWINIDLNTDDRVDVWLPWLKDIDVVINCAGILQSTFQDDADRIHRGGTTALFEACVKADVRRLIHLSAMSAESDVETEYAATKVAADAVLKQLPNNWLIIKPSIVVGSGSHGGTTMIRALAGLPWVTPLPAGGKQSLQPIAMNDLVRGLAQLAKQLKPAQQTLYACGPETLSLAEVVSVHRRWLGFVPVRVIAIPKAMMTPVLKLGDALGYIGNSSAMRSTSMAQMDHMEHADPMPFAEAANITLAPLEKALAATPSTVQDRMHSRSVFPLIVAHGAIALFWIATGLITLLPDAGAQAVAALVQGGMSAGLARVVVTAGAVVDIVLGVMFIPLRWMRVAGILQLALSGIYLIGGLFFRPDLWLDPLGPMVKILPLMAATVLVIALNERR